MTHTCRNCPCNNCIDSNSSGCHTCRVGCKAQMCDSDLSCNCTTPTNNICRSEYICKLNNNTKDVASQSVYMNKKSGKEIFQFYKSKQNIVTKGVEEKHGSYSRYLNRKKVQCIASACQ